MDKAQIPEGISVLWWLIGSGGLGALAVAIVGIFRPKREAAAPSSPIQVESPWMVQNLLEIKTDVEAIKDRVDSVMPMLTAMTVQINTVAALLRRQQRRSK